MINLLKHWNGEIEVNGTHYKNIAEALSNLTSETLSDDFTIKLLSESKESPTEHQSVVRTNDTKEKTITVKQYMTKKATDEFDFMRRWNNDIPMPMRTMQGVVEKETRGMVYMKLHGYGKPTITCLCCGKELTNPVSRYYGIGPICLNKIGIQRDIEDVSGITEELQKITWEGWIIKSAITSEE